MHPTKVEQINASLFCNLPSQLLPMVVANTLATWPKIVTMFGAMIQHYRRDDTPIQMLPSLSAYTTRLYGEDNNYFYKGQMLLEILLPIEIARERITEVTLAATEGIIITLKNQFFFYAVRDLVPGLVKLGFVYDVDLKDPQNTKGDAFSIPINLNFEIDMEQYYAYLESQGIDMTDPCTPVMDTINVVIPIDELNFTGS